MSIDSIIKQAMIDAGMNPVIEKKATGNKLADDLYALAAECEKLGSARVGVAKSAEQSCLRDLTKAYLFQRMLKSAVEDRLGVTDTEFEKSAGEHGSDIRYEYIEAFEKLAAEGQHDIPDASRGEMVLHGTGAGARRGAMIGAGTGLASVIASLALKGGGGLRTIPGGALLGATWGAAAGATHGALRNKNKYLLQKERSDIDGQLDYQRRRNEMLEGLKGKSAGDKQP